MASGLQLVGTKKPRATRKQRILAEIATIRVRAGAIIVLADRLEQAVLVDDPEDTPPAA